MPPRSPFQPESGLRLELPRLAADDSGGAAHETPQAPFLAPDQVRRRNAAIIGAGGLGLFLYGRNKWWQEGFTREFSTVDEGWFGQDTYAGGADKLGHAYATYVGTRLMARTFEWAGNDERKSLALAAWSVLGAYTAVELVDGFTARWHFSREDAVMNVIGTALAVATERHPRLDDIIDFRLLYRPTDGFDPFGDYSGQTYLLVAKPAGIPAWREQPLLRYLELAVGYGVHGYHQDASVQAEKSRSVYVGISLNLTELLRSSVFRDTDPSSRTWRAARGFLEFVQVPGTAALARHRLD